MINNVTQEISDTLIESPASAISISPSGQIIMLGDNLGSLSVWNADTGEHYYSKKIHNESRSFNVVNDVTFNRDGNIAVTSGENKYVRIWEVENTPNPRKFLGHSDAVYALSVSADGRFVVSGSEDRTIRVWNADDGTEIASRNLHLIEGRGLPTRVFFPMRVYGVDISPNNKMVSSVGQDGYVRVWEITTGKEFFKKKFRHTSHSVLRNPKFSEDGTLLHVSSDNRSYVWNTKTWNLEADWRTHSLNVTAAKFNPLGNKLLTAGVDGVANYWDLENRNLIFKLDSHPDDHKFRLSDASISQNGKLILTTGTDNVVRIWDAETGELLRQLRGHKGYIYNAEFSPDSENALTVSSDGTLRIWDMHSGAEIGIFDHGEERVTEVKLSADGNFVFTATVEGVIRRWDISELNSLREQSISSLIKNTEELLQKIHPLSVEDCLQLSVDHEKLCTDKKFYSRRSQ